MYPYETRVKKQKQIDKQEQSVKFRDFILVVNNGEIE